MYKYTKGGVPMEGKWVILIVIIVTLLGIGLAFYFLQTLPSNIKEQSSAITGTIIPNHFVEPITWQLK